MIYFLSDAHLGSLAIKRGWAHQKKLIDMLEMMSKDAASIYMLGDMFDFWFEYFRHDKAKRQYSPFAKEIRSLIKRGIHVHFFIGNHDLWTFGGLAKMTGMEVHYEPCTILRYGKAIYLAHGDGLLPSDWEKIYPKDVQKKALALAINGLDKLQYIDSNKELQSFSGAYNDFSTLMRINALTQNAMTNRLKWSAAATKLGIAEYPVADLLSDITDEVTCNLRKGSVPEGEEFLVEVWMARGLMPSLPVYEQNLKEYNHKAAQLYAPLPMSENLYKPVLENACIAEVERLEGILKRSLRAARGEYDKERVRYLLSQLDGMKGTDLQP